MINKAHSKIKKLIEEAIKDTIYSNIDTSKMAIKSQTYDNPGFVHKALEAKLEPLRNNAIRHFKKHGGRVEIESTTDPAEASVSRSFGDDRGLNLQLPIFAQKNGRVPGFFRANKPEDVNKILVDGALSRRHEIAELKSIAEHGDKDPNFIDKIAPYGVAKRKFDFREEELNDMQNIWRKYGFTSHVSPKVLAKELKFMGDLERSNLPKGSLGTVEATESFRQILKEYPNLKYQLQLFDNKDMTDKELIDVLKKSGSSAIAGLVNDKASEIGYQDQPFFIHPKIKIPSPEDLTKSRVKMIEMYGAGTPFSTEPPKEEETLRWKVDVINDVKEILKERGNKYFDFDIEAYLRDAGVN